jgi:Protein of unknown function (DUF3540)
MSNVLAHTMMGATGSEHIGRAVLVESERENGSVMVRLAGDGPGPLYSAIVACPRTQPLGAGREALVIGTPDDQLYVVGVVAPPDRPHASGAILATADGAYATTSRTGDGTGAERLRVYSPSNQLVFEYDPSSGRTLVNVSSGGLALRTERGDIELQSAGAVRIGGQAINLTGEQVEVRAKRAKWMVDKLETLAGTVMERAKNVYRSVEQLAQLRAGRMRTLVKDTFQFRSRNAYVKAERDYKIKADQIQLG